ncbi:MAG: hypothetical protein M1812_002154 [Candelaria pacifica]|nr:MAG: hypothetical protein M1812_002154 [Candelaria pacifica]
MPGSVHTVRSSDELIDRSVPSSFDFPRPVGQTINVSGKSDRHPVQSPTESFFSMDDRKLPVHNVSEIPNMVDESEHLRPITRGAPGDRSPKGISDRGNEQHDLARQKSQFYHEAFACRDTNSSSKGRVSRDSVVMAELRTNVIIKDEYTFMGDLSSHLSTRFQRPESSILVNLNHSSCLMFGGSFDPAYVLTITALPSQIQPTTNKRNAALTQAFLHDVLGVAAERGVIRFIAIAESNLATNGQTILGEIDILDKQKQELNGGLKSRSGTTKSRKKKSVQPLKEFPASPPTPPLSSPELAMPAPPLPTEKSKIDKKSEKLHKMGRRKSFMAIFGK